VPRNRSPRLDPGREQLHLPGRELLAKLGRRHHVGGIFCRDAVEQQALLRLARRDGAATVPEIGREALGRVHAQPDAFLAALAFGGVRSVAGEALVREDGTNLPLKVRRDGGGLRGRGGEGQPARNAQPARAAPPCQQTCHAHGIKSLRPSAGVHLDAARRRAIAILCGVFANRVRLSTAPECRAERPATRWPLGAWGLTLVERGRKWLRWKSRRR
jgi:hypothetical protein